MPLVLDGIAIAAEIKAEVARDANEMIARGVRPGLAVILVGSVAASEMYVRSKVKTCGELGFYSEMHTPPESVTTEELLALVADLNARDEIDGILGAAAMMAEEGVGDGIEDAGLAAAVQTCQEPHGGSGEVDVLLVLVGQKTLQSHAQGNHGDASDRSASTRRRTAARLGSG